MIRFWRQAFLVLRNELADALRSRRAVVVLLLYVAAGVLTTNSSISLLQKIEGELSEVLQLEASAQAGTVTSAMWKSDRFRRMVAQAAGDKSLVDDLMGTPPIVLIYGGLAFFYTPILAILISAPRIAEELSSGSARYALLRTSRLSWSTGKFLGQVALAGMALVLSGVGAWVVARIRMAASEGPEVATGMLLSAGRAGIFSTAYVGLATGLSHLTRAPGRATAIGLVGLLVFGILGWASDHYYGPGLRQLWHLGSVLTPQAHRLDLWRWDPARLVPAIVHLVTLGWVFLLGGYAWFRRRDL